MQKQKNKRRNNSQNSFEFPSLRKTPRNSAVKQVAVLDSPRGASKVPFCRTCNFKGEKPKGNFLKNAFKKTMEALRTSDTQNKPIPTSRFLDSNPEYDGSPNSIDMLPVPRFFISHDFERELAKNSHFSVSVFVMNRPWWTIRISEELPPYQPISKIALDSCFSKNPAVFDKPPGRKKFYDPLSEDLETLKSLDAVHNTENRVLSNTFYSGLFVHAAKAIAIKKKMSKEMSSDERLQRKKDQDRKKDVSPEVSRMSKEGVVQKTERSVRFAEEPYYIHQYNKKDRDICETPNYRRNFVHTEHIFQRGTSKDSLIPPKSVKKGLVFD